MKKVFFSYSSKDKELALKIANDLKRKDINVWMDEWEILVGDSIIQKVQQGLAESDFFAVLLTHHSISSGWVEKEWQSKFGEEASQRKTVILPLKADDCEIPFLLRNKKYADFSIILNYHSALNDLIKAIKGHVCEAETIYSNMKAKLEILDIHFILIKPFASEANFDAFYVAEIPLSETQWTHLMPDDETKMPNPAMAKVKISISDICLFLKRANERINEARLNYRMDFINIEQWNILEKTERIRRKPEANQIDKPLLRFVNPSPLGVYDLFWFVYQYCRINEIHYEKKGGFYGMESYSLPDTKQCYDNVSRDSYTGFRPVLLLN